MIAALAVEIAAHEQQSGLVAAGFAALRRLPVFQVESNVDRADPLTGNADTGSQNVASPVREGDQGVRLSGAPQIDLQADGALPRRLLAVDRVKRVGGWIEHRCVISADDAQWPPGEVAVYRR